MPHRPRPRFSAFQFGASQQIIEAKASSTERANIELVPFGRVTKDDQFANVAERLVEIANAHAGVQKWLPGVAERYSNHSTASEAIIRASHRKDLVAWILRKVATDTPETEPLDADTVMGIATIHDRVHVATGYADTYPALVSYWSEYPINSNSDASLAYTMLYHAPTVVLRNPRSVIATTDGPVSRTDAILRELPMDPCASFARIGRQIHGVLDPDRHKQTLDGIVQLSHTRLFGPMAITREHHGRI